MKKWLLIIAGSLVGVAIVVVAIGAALPKDHLATRAARYAQPPEAIWQAITDVEAMPSWRTELKAVKRLPGKNTLPAWVETSSFGDLPVQVEEFTPPRRMVTRITDPSLPFGGTWTFEVQPADGGATLRITERGEIRSAMFRFMARFVFGYTATMEQYLKSLGKKFGEEVSPVP